MLKNFFILEKSSVGFTDLIPDVLGIDMRSQIICSSIYKNIFICVLTLKLLEIVVALLL